MTNATFVLVPGAYHGSWCFEKLIPLLEQAGHRAIGVDIPLCPNKTENVTFEDCMVAIDRALPQDDKPVILVGHSMAGQYISAYAQRQTPRVAALCYVTAYLLGNGASGWDLPQVPEEYPAQLRKGHNGLCKWYLAENEADLAGLGDYFYTGCTPEEVENAARRLEPQPFAPVEEKLHLTRSGWGKVPRFYVECLGDRCLFPSMQKIMYSKIRCRKVYSMSSGHSPFYTHPAQLVGILQDIAARVHPPTV